MQGECGSHNASRRPCASFKYLKHKSFRLRNFRSPRLELNLLIRMFFFCPRTLAFSRAFFSSKGFSVLSGGPFMQPPPSPLPLFTVASGFLPSCRVHPQAHVLSALSSVTLTGLFGPVCYSLLTIFCPSRYFISFLQSVLESLLCHFLASV